MLESMRERDGVATPTRNAQVLAVAAAILIAAAGCTGGTPSDSEQGGTGGSGAGQDDPIAEGLEAQADGRYGDAVDA